MPQTSSRLPIQFFERKNAPNLVYIKYEGRADLPTVMFLGGFRSDMMGSKASFLEECCRKRDQSYIRFDYSGHGQSQGEFEEGCISDWAQDSEDILIRCTSGEVILVGSSMGGWISLLLAQKGIGNICALIGIAAAPDFTTWMERDMTDVQRKDLEQKGFFALPSDYDTPYIITKKLIEDGRKNCLLAGDININCPVRLLQGKKDPDVPWETAEKIKAAITGDDVQIFYQDEGNHSLSSPADLALLDDVLTQLSKI